MSSTSTSSWSISKEVLQTEGIRGLYFGGVVNALRDSLGYGFYFWSYDLSTRLMSSEKEHSLSAGGEATRVLLCGGLAGVVTWVSIFPLDVIKTKVQTQALQTESAPLLGNGSPSSSTDRRRLGAIEVARKAYASEGLTVFFRGLAVCSVRAFVVNAAQWALYEWIMRKLRPFKQIPNRH
jgi:solute carrier family 25 carnitine/acylcarnitine transporter 20/29